ncbi:MAG TPA: dTDP-4-dehydrorhamnose 3,5-epimerase [Flavitalea sp.]|nr:dTDP-4-dehydrorhamnose 3,5-epimerase [Flavitalea sp.]
MNFLQTPLSGLILIEPQVYADSRGFFFEAYNQKLFHQSKAGDHFVQDNQSNSSYGVIRGLHYQLQPHAQVKLVRVLTGRIFDVAVDIRKGSPTFGKWYGVELSAENKKQLYIPAGFAHGFSVLSDTSDVLYKCNAFYNKESEGGILYNDPTLKIDWKIKAGAEIVSEKDRHNALFPESKNNFSF